ncbi:MAG: tRNA (adenosine(37)-N6)-threonylcarbamoyltransferase complex ATPase subunit type 1 TsaE [Nitrospiraceae bacterium]|nr:tRNA (adenosine(37)-N6)-threonylcarbamoyltransferase complex ATPase subunit type 1 TsaE [Nitrospiraceae bacterium]
MFEEFFSLEVKPFSKTPDPRFLFLSRSHEEALARLQYAVEEKELVVLTGEIGCGKTTLTRALIDSLGEKHRVVLIINPRLTPSQFLRVVARRFEIEVSSSKDDLLEAIYNKVYEDYEAGITPVIIIDEAQLIPNKDTFEEIRLLTNFQLDDTNLISLVLVGQTDLRRRLNHKAYQPLRQRIGLFFHLGPLGPEEMRGYTDHRLQVAGRSEQLFTEGALKTLYSYSGGVPRIINSLATTALLEGFGAGRGVIDESLIEAAARELGFTELRNN